ncbi:NTP transferase domain-containing protein, partial [Candidatus Peregrinibacteria bacterium]|nr:NTP transferase domain-containing protein [Candidatus Peregrinibacteria bacterium]
MIKKAILPVAGMGTRFLPVTKSSPKEMLPIIDKPVIQYIVEEAVNSGIEEIIFVTGKGKRAIEDYFDSDPELFRTLEMKNKNKEIRELKKLENIAKIAYVRQAEPLGDGHAILSAAHCISEGEDFAVLFGDDIIDHSTPALKQLIQVYEERKTSIIGVQEIHGKEIENYGVVSGRKNDGIINVDAL